MQKPRWQSGICDPQKSAVFSASDRRLAEAEIGLDGARRRATEAANAVMWVELRPAALALVAEQRELQREFVNIVRALSFFTPAAAHVRFRSQKPIPRRAAPRYADTDADVPPVRWQDARAPDSLPLDARGRAFREALKVDAAAKLAK
jgi:hypothetical protein